MKNIPASILRSTPEWQIAKENEKSAQKQKIHDLGLAWIYLRISFSL
jgi:hypothetical protein